MAKTIKSYSEYVHYVYDPEHQCGPLVAYIKVEQKPDPDDEDPKESMSGLLEYYQDRLNYEWANIAEVRFPLGPKVKVAIEVLSAENEVLYNSGVVGIVKVMISQSVTLPNFRRNASIEDEVRSLLLLELESPSDPLDIKVVKSPPGENEKLCMEALLAEKSPRRKGKRK